MRSEEARLCNRREFGSHPSIEKADLTPQEANPCKTTNQRRLHSDTQRVDDSTAKHSSDKIIRIFQLTWLSTIVDYDGDTL